MNVTLPLVSYLSVPLAGALFWIALTAPVETDTPSSVSAVSTGDVEAASSPMLSLVERKLPAENLTLARPLFFERRTYPVPKPPRAVPKPPPLPTPPVATAPPKPPIPVVPQIPKPPAPVISAPHLRASGIMASSKTGSAQILIEFVESGQTLWITSGDIVEGWLVDEISLNHLTLLHGPSGRREDYHINAAP